MADPEYIIPEETEEAAAEKPKRHRLIKSVAKRGGNRAKPQRRAPREAVRAEPRAEPREQGVRLERNRKRTDDRFFVDRQIVPSGMTYEWKRESVYGRTDPHHINQLKDNHWTEVPDGRHAGLITKQDGMILMERPSYLTIEARREDLEIAQDQVRGVHHRIAETPDGTLTRDHPSVRANTKLKRDYVPMNIPE